MWGLEQRLVYIVVFCQFVTAFSALGLPPFFSLILGKSFQVNSSQLNSTEFSATFAGILFVVPTFFAAITSPIWGFLSDRFGKKNLLLRAQLGLSISFLAAGYSRSIQGFIFSLILQGIFGGTFSASRAYLATFIQGKQLANGLTLLESAPRAALVLSPFVMGILIHSQSPIEIYRYLAVLPLLAAILTFFLPHSENHKQIDKQKQVSRSAKSASCESNMIDLTPAEVCILQLLFGISSIMASPYFGHSIKGRFPLLSSGQIGMLFGLPHLVYLIAAAPLSLKLKEARVLEALVLSLLFQAVSLIGQAHATNLMILVFWRFSMGISMTIAFISIHIFISRITRPEVAGGLFGWLEGSVKISTVLGGLIASIGFEYYGSNSLFFMSALAFSSTAALLVCRNWIVSKERPA